MTNITISAEWNAKSERYEANLLNDACIYSEDGDMWSDESGAAIDTEEFHAATIVLVGGPRDGETVG